VPPSRGSGGHYLPVAGPGRQYGTGVVRVARSAGRNPTTGGSALRRVRHRDASDRPARSARLGEAVRLHRSRGRAGYATLQMHVHLARPGSEFRLHSFASTEIRRAGPLGYHWSARCAADRRRGWATNRVVRSPLRSHDLDATHPVPREVSGLPGTTTATSTRWAIRSPLRSTTRWTRRLIEHIPKSGMASAFPPANGASGPVSTVRRVIW
jgi:hypothetical protein